MSKVKVIKPQPKQYLFLSCPADIVVYGGAAGGGKTYALLMDAMRFINDGSANYTIFRRTTPAITANGGLWQTAKKLYFPFNIRTKGQPFYEIIFPSGYNISFRHLQYEDTVFDYQGAQLSVIAFDELTHFTEQQFFYMMSRNRNYNVNSSVNCYIRATCNPDPDSWVRKLLDWYIGENGYAIKERSGKIRYFARLGEKMYWGNTKAEVLEQTDKITLTDEKDKVTEKNIKSFCFIASSLEDNQALLQNDVGYESSLKALSHIDYERLRKGNWNIKASGGEFFKNEYFIYTRTIRMKDIVMVCRAWDLAGTEKGEKKNNSPDATASCLMARLIDSTFAILEVTNDWLSPSKVRHLICEKAKNDYKKFGSKYKIFLPQDPGQAGKAQAQAYVKMLSGYNVSTSTVKGDKITRAEPFMIQMENGNVVVFENDKWNDTYQSQMVSFPEGIHDDMVDATSDAFNQLSNKEDENNMLLLSLLGDM